jgi:hypothetical protein
MTEGDNTFLITGGSDGKVGKWRLSDNYEEDMRIIEEERRKEEEARIQAFQHSEPMVEEEAVDSSETTQSHLDNKGTTSEKSQT